MAAPDDRHTASSEPRAALLRHGSCVLAWRPPDLALLGTTFLGDPLVHTGRRWYLVAWDTVREEWRTFRVDRIDGRPTPDRRFSHRDPPAQDLAAYVARRVSAVRDRYHAEVILHAPLAEVTARVTYAIGTIEAIDEHSCVLRTGAEWLDGLAVYIVSLGVDFEISEPPELIEAVRTLAARFASAVAP
ncbi:MAG TPA: WYL domain-containing protein [Solirubrobacteraceae bacterium]|nr:WYL domain-containing protein [Solirubrobacteraceae bacterium]